jgi:NAD(P)-dependent dehydrogenase (short-subunit alcohol dehydrogenase family)
VATAGSAARSSASSPTVVTWSCWGRAWAATADLDTVRAALETNLFGAWRLTQALLPLLRRAPHPRVVNVSSEAGRWPA